jgi:uncharacterized delta-60 repeat protein
VSGERRQVGRIWKTTLLLVCLTAAAAALLASPAVAKRGGGVAQRGLAGRLDPSFGRAGKAMIPFPAENAGEVGIKYTLPFQFTGGHLVMAAAPGGKTVIAGSTRIARLLPNGKLDRGFGGGGVITIERPAGMTFVLAAVAVDSQGRILIGGSARPLPSNSTPDPLISSAMVMRFAADGSVDRSFGQDGTLVSDFGIKPPAIGSGFYKAAAVGLRSLVVDSQDRPVVTGGSVTKIVNCSGETAVSTGFVARLTGSGTLDSSFGEGGLRQIADLSSFEQGALFPDGGLFTVGLGKPHCAGEGSGPPVVLTGFGPEGNLDPGFGFAGFRAIGYSAAPVATVAPSGKIVLLGAKEKDRQLVIRLLPNGASDPGFGRTGRVVLVGLQHAAFAAVAVDGQGRLLFAGRITKRVSKKKKNRLRRSTFLVARMNPDGTVDRSFGHKGSVRTGFGGPSSSFATQVMLDAQGRILVGGGISTPLLATGGGFALARYLGGD